MTHDFQYLVDLAMEDAGTKGMRPVVEKELLHYDILFALQKGGFLDGLVFQGGTALRLCHGSPRFSEDLDFAGGVDFTSAHLAPLADHLKDFFVRALRLANGIRLAGAVRGEILSLVQVVDFAPGFGFLRGGLNKGLDKLAGIPMMGSIRNSRRPPWTPPSRASSQRPSPAAA